MRLLVLSILLFMPCLLAGTKYSLEGTMKCKTSSDCASNHSCLPVHGFEGRRCIDLKAQLCIGGFPDSPIRTCNRARDCTSNLPKYRGWCDLETKFCCGGSPETIVSLMCPDRVTPMYGQEKCTGGKTGYTYSGDSPQKGGLCYKNYSCPPKISRIHDMSFGRMTYRTNMDCSDDIPVDTKYNFMFCHNATGNLWVIGQLNVNGDEVNKHWTQCKLNKDCGEGLVCVKEDMCRYRCYEDPTMEYDFTAILLQLLAMFLVPLILLVSIIFLTVKHLD